MGQSYDIVIVGAGIAGMSLASRLAAPKRTVLLLDMERGAPHHSTACSSALHDPAYVPGADVAALALMSRELFTSVSEVLKPKSSLHLFGARDLGLFADALTRCRTVGAQVEELDSAAIGKQFPYLRVTPDRATVAIYAPPGVANTIDVKLLYERLRSRFLSLGGMVARNAPLLSAARQAGGWTIRTPDRHLRAAMLVNCAGAWADQVAERCGVAPLGVIPVNHTIVETSLQPCNDIPPSGGPFVFWVGHDEDLYCDFRGGQRVLISQTDETLPHVPNAHARPIDVGTAIFRFEQRTALRVINNKGKDWTGLRTFTVDRKPIIGWSREVAGFFWSGAFGGFGIECALGASALAADLILDVERYADLRARYGVESEHFSPQRFRSVPSQLR